MAAVIEEAIHARDEGKTRVPLLDRYGHGLMNTRSHDAYPRPESSKAIEPGTSRGVMSAIGDLDGDGLKEIAFVDFNGNVLVWKVPGTPTPENLQWSMFRHDAAHTGALR